MKIGVVTFACDAGRSGIGQYLIHLMREFPAVAPELHIEVIGHEDEISVFLPPQHNYAIYPVSTRWQHPILNILWQNVMLPLICRTRRYGAVFLPAANRRLPLRLPCPTVGTVHDFSSIHVAGKYDPLRDFYIRHILPFLVRRLTRVIAVSECTKRDIVQFARVPAGRIAVIPHGVDRDTYHPGDKAEAQHRVCGKYGIRPPYILYISRIEHPGKNHVRLIRAFTQMKQNTALPHQLVLAGSDWTRAEEVHQAAAESGARRDIRFTGFVDGRDLPDIYRGADLFVFASLYEGFGMPILEAMACGVPVACADISSLPEVAGNAALLFDPKDENAIATAMTELISDAERRTAHIAAGLDRAAQFHWRHAAEDTIKEIIATINCT